MRATETLMRMDLRRRRAQLLMHMVMDAVDPFLCDHDPEIGNPRRRLHDALFRTFMEQGVEVLTDHEREQHGLPARGPDGWTTEELVELERKRLEALARPLAPLIVTREMLADVSVSGKLSLHPIDDRTSG